MKEPSHEDPARDPWAAQRREQARFGLSLTPAERLRWLEETMATMRRWCGRARPDRQASSCSDEIVGWVQIIDKNTRSPRWYLYFDRARYAHEFPVDHQASIEIEWPSGTFRHTVALTPSNPIYLWTRAESVRGSGETRVTDLLRRHGLLEENREVRLAVIESRRRYRVML